MLFLGGSKVKVKPFSKNLEKVEYMTGGYGIYVRNTAYNKMILGLQSERTVADISYMKHGLHIFRTKRNLVLHAPGFSFIQQKQVNYKSLNTF